MVERPALFVCFIVFCDSVLICIDEDGDAF